MNLLSRTLMLSLLLTGCASQTEMHQEDGFGDSVRNMIQAQLYDPAAAASPGTQTPAGFDGTKAGWGMDVYRGSIGPEPNPGDAYFPQAHVGHGDR